MRVLVNNVENLGNMYVTAKTPTRTVIPTTINGYRIAWLIPILSFKSFAMKSANWNKTLSRTPALSPAITIFTNIPLKTFGCFCKAFERLRPPETSSMTF